MKSNLVYAGVLGAALLLAGTASPVRAQPADNKPIVFGYSASLTGKFATEATDLHRGYELWAENVNKAGGINVGGSKRQVKLVQYDDGSDANAAIRNYERLISRDGVDFTLSPWGSGINFAISAIVEKHKYPTVLATAAADSIFHRGFKYIFAATQMASSFYDALESYLAENKDKIKTVGIAYENFLFTQSLHDTLLKKLDKLGIKVVADEQYPLGGQDFSALLTKIKAAAPDAFIDIDVMPSSVYMTRQMAELGFRPNFYAVNIGPMYEEEFVKKLGNSAEHVMENGFWHHSLPFDGAQAFYDQFSATYKKPPSTDASYGYIAGTIIQQAIEQAGSTDREKVAQALRTGKFNTVLGPYEFDADGINKDQLSFMAQVQNGKRVVVWPKRVATDPVASPY
jgi:branched-chain amino acid transport system substrate-binding protein